MPLRPFPIPLSIGTDIVHVDRFRKIIAKAQNQPKHLARFLRRFLTPRERNTFAAQYQINERVQEKELDAISKHLAGRWAAKEATIKAVIWRRLSFHDVVILRSPQRESISAVILDLKSAVREQSIAENAEYKRMTTDPEQLQGELAEDSAQATPALEDMKAVPLNLEQAPVPSDPFRELDGQIARITISHDGEYATAVCIAAEQPSDGDVGGEAAARDIY